MDYYLLIHRSISNVNLNIFNCRLFSSSKHLEMGGGLPQTLDNILILALRIIMYQLLIWIIVTLLWVYFINNLTPATLCCQNLILRFVFCFNKNKGLCFGYVVILKLFFFFKRIKTVQGTGIRLVYYLVKSNKTKIIIKEAITKGFVTLFDWQRHGAYRESATISYLEEILLMFLLL
jgi:hypothetical protein